MSGRDLRRLHLVALAWLLPAIGIASPQVAPSAVKWAGTWVLNVPKSTIQKTLVPGVPPDLEIVSLTMKIDLADGSIRLSGDYVVMTGGQKVANRESNTISFDRESEVGPVALTFRRVDDLSFDIISGLIGNSALREVSHFAFSADGKELTETKTQKLESGGTVRTSTSILVFDRKPESE
jgi:hypothetical protein